MILRGWNPRRWQSLHIATALLISALTGSLGCDDDNGVSARCQRAVDHVVMPLSQEDGAANGAPSADEMKIIQAVRNMALVTCQREGLSQAQAECIMAARTIDDRLRLGRCPAIRDRKPSWLQVPPEEILQQIEREPAQTFRKMQRDQ